MSHLFERPAIRAQGLGKCYHLYKQPQDRLKQFLSFGRRHYFREFWAVRDVNVTVRAGEVIGIIGRNGAGKSTLLQMVCGTLRPSHGEIEMGGRIAALLELGAGFNPEFTGRENVWMNAAILGLTQQQIADRFDAIVDFSEVRDFIDQPVKTYSSGMFVRLAFAVAVHVDPDILVIDEALSVGDGNFARKSFERIMALKDAGKTILFCSHSLFQVEAICDRVFWLEAGAIRAEGVPADVVASYKTFLDGLRAPAGAEATFVAEERGDAAESMPAAVSSATHFERVEVFVDGKSGKRLDVASRASTVEIEVHYGFTPDMPTPHIGIALTLADGTPVTSAITHHDGFQPEVLSPGRARVRLRYENIPLMKGSYWVYACLMCENAVLLYEDVRMVAELVVGEQKGREVGYAFLPHRWVR